MYKVEVERGNLRFSINIRSSVTRFQKVPPKKLKEMTDIRK